MRAKQFPNLAKPLSEAKRQRVLAKAQLRAKVERSCHSKYGYFSERKALAVVKGRLGEDPTVKCLRVYKCTYCEFWHITKSA